jgi:hypothetical protein
MMYEFGHGLLATASSSLGACTCAARSMGLRDLRITRTNTKHSANELEERIRVWWGLFTLDRIINSIVGDAMFGLPNPKPTDILPYSDLVWMEQDLENCKTSPNGISATCLDSPFHAGFGQFGRECQIAHLAGRVFQHVFDDPAGNKVFETDEAAQLKRTIWAFLPLLDHAELEIGRSYAALSIACT